MQNLILSPISISDFDDLLTSAVERVIKKYISIVPQPQPETKSNFINIDDFCNLHPKKPAKATVYSQLSLKKIPTELIFKPQGSKNVLFYKDLVLNWIENGMPTNAKQQADDYVNNRK